jgi:hypothetical protein
MIEISIIFLYFLIAGLVGGVLDSIDDDFPEPLAVVAGLLWIVALPIILGVVLGKLIVKIFK